MSQLVEFHGRLSGGAGPLVSPRALRFSLYEAPAGGIALWTEEVDEVHVDAGGGFHVLLGRATPLDPAWFGAAPLWLAVEDVTTGATDPRVPLTGSVLRLRHTVDALEERLGRLEAALGGDTGRRFRRRLRDLHRRLTTIEVGDGALSPVVSTLAAVSQRLDRLDTDDGRLTRIEDELEDLTGPDGDVIDLLERIERLEGSGPVPRPAPPPAPVSRADPRFVAQLADRVEALTARVAAVEELAAKVPTADTLHVVKRSGDTMTGGLVINRGGLDVLSGGIKCRGADVNTLEATIQVKAPKVIADAIELRGDLTVDSTKRTLQVRHVEGRAGGSRKDGTLLLNARSGADVVVGNAEAHAGLTVHGEVRADALSTGATAHATAMVADDPIEPGEVCVVTARGHAARATEAGQRTVIGVCVATAAVTGGEAGDGRALVAWGGVATVRVTGEVSPGDLLVASAIPGRAERAPEAPTPGTVIGKALTPAKGDEVSALLSLR